MRRALFLLLLFAPQASACSIPVFRYAFENWKPSPYAVHVLHCGPLTDEQRDCVQTLRQAQHSNITVTDVELPLGWVPLMLVRQPDADAKSLPAAFVPLTRANVEALLDSPMRRRIVDHLGRGKTAVFLLLESGDSTRDDAIAKMLADEQARLEATPLPKPSKEGTQPRSTFPLTVEFLNLRMSRTDPREAAFVRMLLTSEPDLEKEKGPIVMVIFGRGRLLAALRNDNLDAEEMAKVAEFLCKKCTCELPNLNPGTDLLFTADWESFVTGAATPESDRNAELRKEPEPESFKAPRTQVMAIVLRGMLEPLFDRYWPLLMGIVVLVVMAIAIWWYRRR